MAKVTSKYQVTVPKAIAEQYCIQPGDEIDWVPSGETIRVIPSVKPVPGDDREFKLLLFDQATERVQKKGALARKGGPKQTRGWTREDLYDRGRSR